MPTVAEVTNPLLHTYTRVLPVTPGVCRICHGAPNAGFSVCYSCDETLHQVTRPVKRLVPISLYRHDSQLHICLYRYKNSAIPTVRDRFRLEVAAMIGRFFLSHRACLVSAGGDWDAIVVVPSSGSRPGVHPLEAVFDRLPWKEVVRRPLRRSTVPIGHNRADEDGYEVTANVIGQRYLLLDDTFTTGARLQSAASALQAGGAVVTTALVVGRILNPDYNESSRRLWDAATSRPFTFDRCCLCAPEEALPGEE